MNAVTTFTQVLNQLAYMTMLGLAILFLYDGRVVSRYWLKRTNIAVYEEEITELPTIITYVRPINDKITLGRDFKIFYQTGLNEYSDPWNELKHGENSIKDSLLSVSFRHFYQGLTAEKYVVNIFTIAPRNFSVGMPVKFGLKYVFNNAAGLTGSSQIAFSLSTENGTTLCTLGKIGRKFRNGFCLQFFQASWAKNFDLLRVIAVHGTMTIEFYTEF